MPALIKFKKNKKPVKKPRPAQPDYDPRYYPGGPNYPDDTYQERAAAEQKKAQQGTAAAQYPLPAFPYGSDPATAPGTQSNLLRNQRQKNRAPAPIYMPVYMQDAIPSQPFSFGPAFGPPTPDRYYDQRSKATWNPKAITNASNTIKNKQAAAGDDGTYSGGSYGSGYGGYGDSLPAVPDFQQFYHSLLAWKI